MYDDMMLDIYKRTLNNCEFYEKENKPLNLLNEIGVLRGVAYCLEAAGLDFAFNNSRFEHFIKVQQELKNAEG